MNRSAAAMDSTKSAYLMVVGMVGSVRSGGRFGGVGLSPPGGDIRRSVMAIAMAERKATWNHGLRDQRFLEYRSALMKVLSRWIDEMPMIAVASLTFEHRGVDMRKPFRLVGWLSSSMRETKGFVATDDDHDQQVGDHHHVDQAQHQQYDQRFGELWSGTRRTNATLCLRHRRVARLN